MSDLISFIRESNAIERIYSEPEIDEDAHLAVLHAETMTVDVLREFVLAVADAVLRDQPGRNVRVGNHIAPPSGPLIVSALQAICDRANANDDPHDAHLDYETLHPFMDGNGRSGRVLWLWMMLKQGRANEIAPMGFLQTWYYQTLARSREAK